MPKEITHWSLAVTLADNLPGDSLFYEPVRSFPYLFLLGAITPDIPFYYLAGPKTAAVQSLSVPFHGTDERTLLPVLLFLDKYPDHPPAALAFAAGVISHILADTLFHPLVYYFTGMDGVHPGATARHREFETAMDLYFLHLSQGRSQVSLARVMNHLEVSKQQCSRFMAALFQTENRLEKRCLTPALYFHMTLQRLFRSRLAYNTLAFLNRKTPWIPDKVVGLMYPVKGPVNLGFFSRPLEYRDPCTGEAFSAGIQEMQVKSGKRGKKLLGLISENLIRGGAALGVLNNPDLPEIRPGFDRESVVFWREKQDLVSDLYDGF
jgi:Zinc dependent phospholipase C